LGLLPLLILGCMDSPDSGGMLPTEPPSALLGGGGPGLVEKASDHPGGRPLDRYIVRYVAAVGSERARELSADLAGQVGGTPVYHFTRSFRGMSVAGIESSHAEALAGHPSVQSVRQVYETPVDGSASTDNWALDRIDQDSTGVATPHDYNWEYDGSGVHIYVVDTGVWDGHDEFSGGRLGNGRVFLADTSGGEQPTNPYWDQHGHGTGVASQAGGNSVGVAHEATIHSLRVSKEGEVASDDLIKAIDWVADSASTPAVVSVSISMDDSDVADAIDNLITSGITLITSAANDDGADACNYEMHEVSDIVVVGSTEKDDDVAGHSNIGSCVTLFAPGVDVEAASISGASSYHTPDGTSYAAPLTAGVAALILEQGYVSPTTVREVLQNSAGPGKVNGYIGLAPNRLLYAFHSWAWVDGPKTITTTGDHTWTPDTIGGDGSWSYLWEESIDGGAFTTVGSSNSYTKTITANDCYEALIRLTPTTAGDDFVVIHSYTVSVSGMCPH